MRLRPFLPSDADAVNAVALAAFSQYEGVYREWQTLMLGVGAMASLSEQAELIVAEDDGAIVGAVAYCAPRSAPRADFFEPDWPIIRMLVVQPQARGRGIGRKLTEQCIDRARRDAATVIALHTSPAMAAALELYLKMGFRLERPLPDRSGVPYGLYLLSL